MSTIPSNDKKLKDTEKEVAAVSEAQEVAKTEVRESFFKYSVEVVTDILLGITLGVIVNLMTDYIAAIFEIHGILKLPIQLFLIVIVLYIMRIYPGISYPLRTRSDTYGVIFIPVFITAQRNFAIFFSDIYKIF